MTKDNELGRIITPAHTAAYVNLFEPSVYKDKKTGATGKPTYGYLALFPEAVMPDFEKIVERAKAVAKAEWGDDVDLKTVEMPFKNASKEADRLIKENGKNESQVAFYRQYRSLIKVSSQFKPAVVEMIKGSPDPVEIIDTSRIYSGVLVRSELNLVARKVNANKFVKAYVNFVLKVGDGPRLSGRDAKTVFKGLLGEASNTDVADDDVEY